MVIFNKGGIFLKEIHLEKKLGSYCS